MSIDRSSDAIESSFLRAIFERREQQARRLVRENPHLRRANICSAAILGNSDFVRRQLQEKPALARQTIPPRNLTVLHYLAVSPFHRDGAQQAADIVESAGLLLRAGADPNSSYSSAQDPDSRLTVLYLAAGVANNAALTKLLLDAGASPDDNESLYHAAEHNDQACLRLLLESGARVAGTNVLKRKLDFDDIDGTQLLLRYGADPNEYAPNALHHAIVRGRNAATIALLLDHGAKIDAQTPEGLTAYALAHRYGRQSAEELLLQRGADTQLSRSDRFFAHCMRNEAEELHALLKQEPDLIAGLSEHDRLMMLDAVDENRIEAVDLMLRSGIPVDIRNWHGTALHRASYFGHAAMIDVLLRFKPDLDLESLDCFGGTALANAVYASVHGPKGGNHKAVVKSLLRAGAIVHDRMTGMGTEEVTALLKSGRLK